MPNSYKIYLDACCLNRPFDDQTQDRIRIESESITIILKNTRTGKIKLIGSDILLYEINKTPNPIRKSQLKSITKFISKFSKIDLSIQNRAKELVKMGFMSFDALHIACAEKENVNVLLTTDDKIYKLYQRNKNDIYIIINNPVNWLKEILLK